LKNKSRNRTTRMRELLHCSVTHDLFLDILNAEMILFDLIYGV